MPTITQTQNGISSKEVQKKEQTVWSSKRKFWFRTGFLFILVECVPINPSFYKELFRIDFWKITYHDIQSVAAFMPPQLVTIETEEGVFGVLNYVNFLLVFLLALIGALIWGYFDKGSKHYDKLQYWIRVLARYRLAYGMVGWGLKKVFPMQMVYPTIGMLNTPFVDFAEKKLYWSHVGVSFGYTVFLGFAEVIPGLLLLHRKTATLGAALAAVVCFNIGLANHAYDAGVAIPAVYYTLLGIYIMWYDFPKIWGLLVNERDVQLTRYYPSLSKSWQKCFSISIKTVFNFIFVFVAAALWGYGFYGNRNNYNIPNTPGLAGSKGYYEVVEFRHNNEVIPYSPLDSIRWQDATFEQWSSISYKTNRPADVDRMIGYSPLRVIKGKGKSELNEFEQEEIARRAHPSEKRKRDLQVTRWEVGGMAGARRYFYYDADTVNRVLYLQNKNKNHSDETQILQYTRPDSDRFILTGINEFRDSIQVELKRSHKRYPLVEGRKNINNRY